LTQRKKREEKEKGIRRERKRITISIIKYIVFYYI